jgi:hypothetical protein
MEFRAVAENDSETNAKFGRSMSNDVKAKRFEKNLYTNAEQSITRRVRPFFSTSSFARIHPKK